MNAFEAQKVIEQLATEGQAGDVLIIHQAVAVKAAIDVKPLPALPWSWWRALLPLGVVPWHNPVYIAVGFIWLAWKGCGPEGNDLRIRRRHTVDRYQFGSLVCAAIFLDNVLRSGGNDVIVRSAGLMLACQFLHWSGIVVGGQNLDC